MSRLAAPCRRNGFVILQAVRSLPAALHPALLRRSYLQLHVLRLHIGRTFTLLTRQHHRRTHSRESGDPVGHDVRPCVRAEPRPIGKVAWALWILAFARMTGGAYPTAHGGKEPIRYAIRMTVADC